MKISLNWIRDYVQLEASAEQIAEALPMLGLEIESITETGLPQTDNLVVGEVLSREQHPDADRLGVCQVRVAPDMEPQQIVCGATNYKVGDRVPVALPGAVLPGDFKIKKSKLRGVESNGMMCSAKELGLGSDHAGLLILDGEPEVGTPMEQLYPDRDTVFEIELTANRGDCLGQIGVARDLAAYFRSRVKLPEVKATEGEGAGLISSVEVGTENCPYYTAWSAKGVKVAPSPEWLKTRLESVGLRPINNVVDVTNYVLMEAGQPLHAFDAKKIRGGKIVVRQANEGESITTLDEKKHELTGDDMVIADSERPLVIAGVMGSVDAEVDDTTTDIVLESAWFRPGAVRATSRRHNIHTDSSYRFARDVDPAGVLTWGRRALDLILELAGGEIVGPCLIHGQPPRGDREIAIDGDFVRKKCGYSVADERIVDVFVHLGFTVRDDATGGGWLVNVPSFRPEVDRPIDLVEEFVRIDGTVNIPEVAVKSHGLHRSDAPLSVFNQKVQDILAARQFQECCHYSLCDGDVLTAWGSDEKVLSLANPLTSEMSHLRASLLPGLVNAIRHNHSHGNTVGRLFETGRIFTSGPKGLTELTSVAFVICMEKLESSWREREAPDFYTAKAIIDSLAGELGRKNLPWQTVDESTVWQAGHAASAEQGGVLAKAGLLSIDMLKNHSVDRLLLAGELSFAPEVLAKRKDGVVAFRPFSDQPSTERDLALVVDASVTASELVKKVSGIARKVVGKAFLVEDVRIFDVYSGKGLPDGQKSLALSIRFRAADRTLTDKEVNDVFGKILTAVRESGYIIRG